MKRCILALLLAAVSTAGCKNRLAFVTQTSVGLDLSGTANYPNKVSFSYGRYEGAIVPRKTGGINESHSVYGGMDSDVKFSIPPKYRIEQVFATGEAAALAAQDTQDSESANPPCPEPCPDTHSNDTKPLIFLTGTTLGIHFTAGEQELNPTALIGYRRREATMIPIADSSREARSVYADIHISSRELDAKEMNGAQDAKREVADQQGVSQWGGVRIKQSFATGQAAETIARHSPVVRAKLDKAAGIDDTRKILIRNHERGLWLADEIGKELDQLENEALNAAVDAFEEAGIIDDLTAVVLKKPDNDPRTTCLTLKKKASEFAASPRLPSDDLQKLEKLHELLKKLTQPST